MGKSDGAHNWDGQKTPVPREGTGDGILKIIDGPFTKHLTKKYQAWYNKMLSCSCGRGLLPLLTWGQCSTCPEKRQGTWSGIHQRVRVFGKRPFPWNCRFSTKKRAVFPANGPENRRSTRLVQKKAS